MNDEDAGAAADGARTEPESASGDAAGLDSRSGSDPASSDPARATPHPAAPAGGEDGSRPRRSLTAALGAVGDGALVAAVAVAASVVGVVLAFVSGALTLLGWGAVVIVGFVGVVVAVLVRGWPARTWLALPLVALGVPAIAVAASGFRVEPQRGPMVVRPAAVDAIPDRGYRAGFGELLVDLRELRPAPRTTTTIEAGSDLRRTVVALPHRQCFTLDVRWKTGGLRVPWVYEQPQVTGFAWNGRAIDRWARRSRNGGGPPDGAGMPLASGRIALFGRVRPESEGRWVARASDPDAPTLRLNLESQGGSFVVRDYPEDVGPLGDAEWPLNVAPPPSPAELRSDWATRPGSAGAVTLDAVNGKVTAVKGPTRPRARGDAARAARTTATDPALPSPPPDTRTTASGSVRTAEPLLTTGTGRRTAAQRRADRELARLLRSHRGALARMIGRDHRRNLSNVRAWERYDRERTAFARRWKALVTGPCGTRGELR